MDPVTPKNSTEEDKENFDELLKHTDPFLLQRYEKCLHDIVVRGISHYRFNLNRLSDCLVNLHHEAMDSIVEKAVSYYDSYAPGNIKYYGMELCKK